MLNHQRPPEKEKESLLGRFFKKVDGCDVQFQYNGKDPNNMATIDDPYDRTSEKMHVFQHTEPIQGVVALRPKGSYTHKGILVEFIGVITTLGDKEDKIEFLHRHKTFDPATISQPTNLDFSFPEDKEYESYRGVNAKVSYLMRVTIQRPLKNVVETEEIWVSKIDHARSEAEPDANDGKTWFREKEFGPQSVSMEVGVDNLLHIEFKYDKKVFHLKERVLGKVTFKVMDLDLQYGEIALVRKEFIGPGRPNDPVETETLQKFEIMDGTPIVGEVVPIRLYLNAVPRLTPSYPNIHNCFRVVYFLNLVLITGEGKRYFKQQEIFLYRRSNQVMPSNMVVQAATS
jgi:vacuolar protein sorting-associated protein 26